MYIYILIYFILNYCKSYFYFYEHSFLLLTFVKINRSVNMTALRYIRS